MIKCKVFTGGYRKVEGKVNQFLSQIPNSFNTMQIFQSESDVAFTISIFYETTE